MIGPSGGDGVPERVYSINGQIFSHPIARDWVDHPLAKRVFAA
jgi:hypothetical protein